MDFFRNQWDQINQPSRPRYPTAARGVPIHPASPRYAPTTKTAPVYPVPPRNAPTTKPPKVVSIPVHFVGAEKNRSASAVKIQKVFRGFLVRKSLRKIASIRRDVEEVERTITRRETVDSIRRVPMERVRLNETLMSLLFKLDSVRGVDSGVRDFRKSVIKKAIALQERIDDIASGIETVSSVVDEDGSESDAMEILEIEEQTPKIEDNSGNSVVDEDGKEPETLGIVEQSPGIGACQDNTVEKTLEIEEQSEHRVPESGAGNDNQSVRPEIGGGESSAMAMEEVPNPGEDEPHAISYSNNSQKQEEGEEEEEEHCSAGAGSETSEKMDISDYVVIDDKVGDDDVCEKQMDTAEENVKLNLEESVDTSPTTVALLNPSTTEVVVDGGATRGDRNTELLEKMMEDNKRMMEMMTQLFEKNEMQTRMLNSLSQRVGQLEKAFVCDRLRRKKRQNGDGSGSSPDQKRGGKNK